MRSMFRSMFLDGDHMDSNPVLSLSSCEIVEDRSLVWAHVLHLKKGVRIASAIGFPGRWQETFYVKAEHSQGVLEVMWDDVCEGLFASTNKCWLANKRYCFHARECSQTLPEKREWGHHKGWYHHPTFSAGYPPFTSCLKLPPSSSNVGSPIPQLSLFKALACHGSDPRRFPS